MVCTVEVGLPSLASERLGCTSLESSSNVVKDEVTTLRPFSIPVIAEVLHDFWTNRKVCVILAISVNSEEISEKIS